MSLRSVPHTNSARSFARQDSFLPHAGSSPWPRWCCLALLFMPLLVSTFLAKLAMPGFDSRGLGIATPLILLTTAVGVVSGVLVLHRRQALLYVLMLAWILAVQLLGQRPYSALSLMFLAVLFMPTAFQVRQSLSAVAGFSQEDALHGLGSLGTFFATCGVVQYAAQFVVPTAVAFPIEFGLPSSMLVKGFNYLNPLSYGSSTFKSNGIFFHEPSFYSQFIALCLLLELSLWNRPYRIVLYLLALVVTYSGTGVVILATGVLTILVVQRRWQLLVAGAIAAVLAVAMADLLSLDIFLQRTGEFGSTRSSGFERFVAWTYMFDQHWWPFEDRVLIGTGAGTFVEFADKSPYSTAEMSFSKMFFEFGLSGGCLFFLMLFAAIFGSGVPLGLKIGLATSLFLNGSYSSFTLGLLLTLTIWPVLNEREPAPGSSDVEHPVGGGMP